MAVQLTTAGNFLARTRRTEPTGEKHRITWMQDTEEPFKEAGSAEGKSCHFVESSFTGKSTLRGLSSPCLESMFPLLGPWCDHYTATDDHSTDFTTLASDVRVQGSAPSPPEVTPPRGMKKAG